jgi:hypothetical protein
LKRLKDDLKQFIKAYVGCYNDYLRQLTDLTDNMALSLGVGPLQYIYFVHQPTLMTISYCTSLCYKLNFQYAGINAG